MNTNTAMCDRASNHDADNLDKTEERIGSSWAMLWYALLAGNLLTVGASWLSLLCSQPLKGAVIPVLAIGFAIFAATMKRREFLSVPASKSNTGLIVLFAVCVGTTLSALFQLNRLHAMASVPLVASFLWATSGFRRLRVVAPVLFLSLFILPDVPDEVRTTLSLPLQNLCTQITGQLCSLMIPIQYHDHIFFVRGDAYDVATSCSGLSMLSTFIFAFGILQAFEKVKPIAYLCMIFLDPCMTMFLNSVRLIVTALAGFFVSQPFALSIHTNIEYFLLAFGMVLLWSLGRRFNVVS